MRRGDQARLGKDRSRGPRRHVTTARCFGGWRMQWLFRCVVVASSPFPVCKVIAFGAGSAFVTPELVTCDVERVRAIAPFPGKEVLRGGFEVMLGGFSRFVLEDALLDPEREAFG